MSCLLLAGAFAHCPVADLALHCCCGPNRPSCWTPSPSVVGTWSGAGAENTSSCNVLTVLLCSSAKRLYSTFCCPACFFSVSTDQDRFSLIYERRRSAQWGRTEVAVLAVGHLELSLELGDPGLQVGALHGRR